MDFDFASEFNLKKFALDVKDYFDKELQYKDLEIKISGKENTLFLKLPILANIGLAVTAADSSRPFVRCDFARESLGRYQTEIIDKFSRILVLLSFRTCFGISFRQ